MVSDMGYRSQAEFVFILGMHRSGTSCLAGCLQRCGLYLGNVQVHSRHNQKGNHELRTVRRIHDRILKKNGGRWDRPPAKIDTAWFDRIQLAWVAHMLKRQTPCGIKDPRMLFLLDIWIDIVRSYTMIGTYRHPISVIRSLQKRDHITFSDGLYIWLTYNHRLVFLHKIHQFPIICFDLTSIEEYFQLVVHCAEKLELRPNLDKIRDFVTVELQHQSDEQLPVPEACQELYAYLDSHCVRL